MHMEFEKICFGQKGVHVTNAIADPTGGNVEVAAGSGTVRPYKRGGKPIREAGVCIKNFGSDLPC